MKARSFFSRSSILSRSRKGLVDEDLETKTKSGSLHTSENYSKSCPNSVVTKEFLSSCSSASGSKPMMQAESSSASIESGWSSPQEAKSMREAESFLGSLDLNDGSASSSEISMDVDRPVSGSELRRRTINARLKRSASDITGVFKMFEKKSGSGVSSVQNLREHMRRVGFKLSEAEAETLLKVVDDNGDGALDLDGFFAVYESLCEDDYEDDSELSSSSDEDSEDEDEDYDNMLHAAFRTMDKNQDGFITARELQMMLMQFGMAHGISLHKCKKMILAVDPDGQEELDFDDFKAVLCSKCFHI